MTGPLKLRCDSDMIKNALKEHGAVLEICIWRLLLHVTFLFEFLNHRPNFSDVITSMHKKHCMTEKGAPSIPKIDL